MTNHLNGIPSVGARRTALHDDAMRLREGDRSAPLGRLRADPFAKPAAIGSNGQDDALTRPRQAGEGVIANGAIEQRRGERALAWKEHGREPAPVKPLGGALSDSRGSRAQGRDESRGGDSPHRSADVTRHSTLTARHSILDPRPRTLDPVASESTCDAASRARSFADGSLRHRLIEHDTVD